MKYFIGGIRDEIVLAGPGCITFCRRDEVSNTSKTASKPDLG